MQDEQYVKYVLHRVVSGRVLAERFGAATWQRTQPLETETAAFAAGWGGGDKA
jgi:hypothetical protein